MRATAFPLSRCAIDLEGSSVGDHAVSVQSPLSVGLFAGKWCSYAESTDLSTDQRLEDGGSLVFDTPPLTEDIEILGAPSVELALTVDRPQAMIAVRLADVGRSDSVTLVSFGLLNLSHRDSDEQPEPLEPGRRYRVTVPLNHVAQRFPAGNRIRVAVSTSYWPLAWPAPEPARLTLFTGLHRVTGEIETFEASVMAEWPGIEQRARELYGNGEAAAARAHLTEHVHRQLLAGLDLGDELVRAVEAETRERYGIRMPAGEREPGDTTPATSQHMARQGWGAMIHCYDEALDEYPREHGIYNDSADLSG